MEKALINKEIGKCKVENRGRVGARREEECKEVDDTQGNFLSNVNLTR